ncbi:MAG TPA: protein-disulfide reductase DsbD domain-containing protein, partial [Terracidiphilus sp.]|nr:protein-disulfide reductase DsbD domain-containing protein [Terracidiphilus sp.]
MRFFRPILALALLLTAAVSGFAATGSADLPHVHVQLIGPDAQFHLGSNNAGLYFKLEPGWHVYWKNPGDAGEPPHIKWRLPQGITAGPIEYPIPKRLPLGPLMDFGYEDEVLFPFHLNAAGGASGSAVLHAKVDWLVCRGSCIPEKTELEITRPIAAGSATVQPDQSIWARLSNKLPAPPPANLKIGFVSTPAGFRLTVNTGHRETEASFFPSSPDILSNPAPQTATPTANGLMLDLKKDESLASNPKELAGLLQLSGGRAYELVAQAGPPKAPKPVPVQTTGASVSTNPTISANTASPPSQSSSPAHPASGPGLLQAFGLAFLGGLVLNLMPCVFPVL